MAGTLQVDGSITANSVQAGVAGTGGAGGSVWIETGTLVGNGTIQACGGPWGDNCGGGGGRIAIYYQTNTFAGTVAAPGGFGRTQPGGAGTIYSEGPAGTLASVVLDNAGLVGAYTPADAIGGRNVLVTVANGAQATIGGGQTWTVNQLLLATNGTVFCYSTNNTGPIDSQWLGRGVEIQAQNVLIQTGAVLSADGLGYAAGQGPGAGIRYGSAAGGGGYGGPGQAATAASGGTYGWTFAPVDIGSGGSDAGNPGGGAIHLVAGTLQMDGLITANGVHYSYGGDGGGSGGSILIEAGTLSGAGTIQANGAAVFEGNGGGGGRVAIYYQNPATPPGFQITVYGGWWGVSGGAGTVYVSPQPYFSLGGLPAWLHGIAPVSWTAAGLSLYSGDTAEIVIARDGTTVFDQITAATGGAMWDTIGVSAGLYQLLITFRDASGRTLGQVSQAEWVNNSVALHSGVLSANDTWTSNTVHVVDQNIFIPNGVTITLQPGAIVKFAKGTGITVRSGGILNALATADAPIVLTSLADDTAGGDTNMDGDQSRPQPGDWPGISVLGGQFNETAYVDIRYITVTLGGTLAGSQSWLGTSVYIVTESVEVPNGVTLTINPGAVIKFAAGAGITVDTGGTLNALGTVVQPITFTSLRDDSVGGDSNGDGNATAPAPGDWVGLNTSSTVNLDHCAILYGGNTGGGQGASGVIIVNAGTLSLSTPCGTGFL